MENQPSYGPEFEQADDPRSIKQLLPYTTTVAQVRIVDWNLQQCRIVSPGWYDFLLVGGRRLSVTQKEQYFEQPYLSFFIFNLSFFCPKKNHTAVKGGCNAVALVQSGQNDQSLPSSVPQRGGRALC